MTKYKIINVLLGNNEEDAKYVKLISEGKFYEGYKPIFRKTTGFDLPLTDFIKLGSYIFNSKKNERFRNILSINDLKYYNIKREEYSPPDDRVNRIYSSIYKEGYLGNERVNDGFGYSADNKDDAIYYYDFISGRKLRFDHKKSDTMNKIDCEKYVLNNNLSQNLFEPDTGFESATVYQRFNKPFIITNENHNFVYKIQKTNKESYICVDPFSYMVISSDINIVYAINSTGCSFKNSESLKEGVLPLINYNRHHDIGNLDYKNIFSNMKNNRTSSLLIFVLGIIIAIIFIALCIYYIVKIVKKDEISLLANNENKTNEIIPSYEKDEEIAY